MYAAAITHEVTTEPQATFVTVTPSADVLFTGFSQFRMSNNHISNLENIGDLMEKSIY